MRPLSLAWSHADMEQPGLWTGGCPHGVVALPRPRRRISCKTPARSRNSRAGLVASPTPPMDVARSLKRGTAAAVLGLLVLPVSSLGDLEHDLSARSLSQTRLRASIAAETRRIEATRAGVETAQRRLA